MNRLFSIILLLLIIRVGCYSQSTNYTIKTLTPDDGLSQGSNYFRFEDSKGYMWITGNDALNRYDGASVKVYNLNYFFKNCPALQQGYGFAEDGKNLYVGSIRGLYMYDYDLDLFTLIEIYKNTSPTKTAMPIGFANGKIWCFNEAWQLASYDIKTQAVTIEAQIPLEPLKSVHVYAGDLFYWRMPFLDKHNNICFISKNNLAIYNLKTKVIHFPLAKFIRDKQTTLLSSAYSVDEDQLYIGTVNGEIIRLGNNYRHVKFMKAGKKNISEITVSKDKIVFKSDLHSMNFCDKTFENIQTLESYNTGYQYNFDKAGRLWVCKDGFGQVIFDFEERLLKNSNNIDNGKMVFPTGVGYFVELPDGRIVSQNTYILDAQKGVYEKLDHVTDRLFGDPYKKGIWSVEDDGLLESNASLDFLDYQLKKKYSISWDKRQYGIFKHLTTFPDSYPMLSFNNGLFWLNTDKWQLEKINSLPGENPFYINPLSKNRVAISYLNADMVLVQKNPDGNFKMLQQILPHVQSFYIQEDTATGNFWVGSNEGVFLLDKNFIILKKFDSNNGLAGTYIYGLLLDDRGNVWCSHQRGISSINATTWQIINFDKTDNIQEWDFNNRSFYKATDGTLYFGGMNGFNYFKPPLQLHSVYNPEIYVDEILINNQRYAAKNGLNKLKEIQLKNDENDISIKALVKDLLYGKKRELYYRIKNIDTTWKKILHKEAVNFSNLAPGKYELEFAIADKFNPQKNPAKKITIVIATPFYQTAWFWTIIGGLIVGGTVYVYSRWRLARQQSHFRQRLELETQRNKITADLHDDIGASLSSLQVNSLVATKLIEKDIEKAKEVLEKIEIQSQHLTEKIGDFIWSMKPGKDEFIGLSGRIKNFASEILGNSGILYDVDTDEQVDKLLTDINTRKNILFIAKEAINNTVKYSNASHIKIALQMVDAHTAKLLVADNGSGFDPGKITGNGIGNMKKRAGEIKGEFNIQSRINEGTSLSVVFSLVPNI